jgi:hypothetical protein
MVRFLAVILLFLLINCNLNFFSDTNTLRDYPLVVITFDDAFESIYTLGFKLMRAVDTSWSATHFFPNNCVGLDGYVTLDQLKEMESFGWESGGHGRVHANLSSVQPDTMAAMVKDSYDFLADNGLSHESYAYASGNYNDTVKEIVSHYFPNIRTGRDYYYLDGIDRKNLGYYAVKSGCSIDDIILRVEEAKRSGSPLVIIGFHTILPDSAQPLPVYWCKESIYKSFLLYLHDQHLQVMSIRNAMGILTK